MCVQNFDDSRGPAFRITYRISLRSSSLWKPRHPLLKVVYILCIYSVTLAHRSLNESVVGRNTLLNLGMSCLKWFGYQSQGLAVLYIYNFNRNTYLVDIDMNYHMTGYCTSQEGRS